MQCFYCVSCTGFRLPLTSVRLLVPPLHLMSAFMWQVLQQKNVIHYGKLEEFVSMVTETVPHLLNYRQRVQLILGLRARVSVNSQNRNLDTFSKCQKQCLKKIQEPLKKKKNPKERIHDTLHLYRWAEVGSVRDLNVRSMSCLWAPECRRGQQELFLQIYSAERMRWLAPHIVMEAHSHPPVVVWLGRAS